MMSSSPSLDSPAFKSLSPFGTKWLVAKRIGKFSLGRILLADSIHQALIKVALWEELAFSYLAESAGS